MTANLAPSSPALTDFDVQARSEIGNRFHLEALHQRGPNSLVYRTGQVFAGKPVVLKVISRGALAERFARAATAAAQMEHPHVVAVLESGETSQFLWYTMPLVEGRSLDQVIAEDGPLDLKRCLRMIEQVASGLQYGHRRGVVHGNVKPENVIIGPDGWTLVTDFGIPGATERTGDIGMSDRLFAYLAPELLESTQPVPASDQYAMAVLIHESLTGAVPTSRGSPDEPAPINPKIARPRITRASRALPDRVIPALRRAMAKTPPERFPSVLGFVAILDGGSASPSVSASFATSPNKKSEPRVLTMEPESHRGRILLWVLLLGIVAGAFFAGGRSVPPGRFQKLADRMDRWYEADPPPGGIVVQPTKPADPVNSPVFTPTRPVEPVNSAARIDSSGPVTTPVARQAPVNPTPRTITPRPAAAAAAPPRRTPAPAPAPARPPVQPEPVEPARLFVNATPWGTVYLDGRPVGNTPLLNLQVSAGTHTIRIVHDGFEPYERTIEIVSGEPFRLTGIVLEKR